jgi:hypothetical protein
MAGSERVHVAAANIIDLAILIIGHPPRCLLASCRSE